MTLLGWELPNIADVADIFWQDFATSRAEIAKTRLFHGLEVYERALQINPACRFLLRPTDEGRLNAYEQYDKLLPKLIVLQAHGIQPLFQTWSEPDHVDGRYGGPGSRDGAQEFTAELSTFLDLLMGNFLWLETVSPPLVVTAEQTVFDEICGSVFAQHSYIGHHAYWQGDYHLSAQWGLRILSRMQQYPDKQFIVSEVGDSSNDGRERGAWTPAAVQYERILQWYNEVRKEPQVEAACIFIGRGSTLEWMGWWPSDVAIEMIRNRGGEGMAWDRHEVFDLAQKALGGEGFNPATAFGQFVIAHPDAHVGIYVGRILGYDRPDWPYLVQVTTQGLLYADKQTNIVRFARSEEGLPLT